MEFSVTYVKISERNYVFCFVLFLMLMSTLAKYEEGQLVSSRLLSLLEKISHCKYKTLTHINININIGCQVAVCVTKWHKNAIFWCRRFQKFNIDCLLHKFLNGSPKIENILNFACSLLTKSPILI